MTTWEYEVQERFSSGNWSRHGYLGPNYKAAEESLDHLRAVYGKYGRVFRIRERVLSDWKVINDR